MLNINFRKPSGQTLASKLLRVVGFALGVLGIMALYQGAIVDEEKSLVTITMSIFLLAMSLLMISSAKEVFTSKFLIIMHGFSLILIYCFLAAMAKINVIGGIVALPFMACLYLPTFVLVRDVFSTPKNNRVITGKILYAKYFYYFAFVSLIISLIIDSTTADFNL